MTAKFKKSTALLLSIAMLLTMVIAAPVVSAAPYDDGEADAAAAVWSNSHYLYFYDQLTPDAKKFYDAMKTMYEDGTFKTGTGSYDLVAGGVVTQEQLAAYAEGDNALLNTYGAARDAFFADYPEVFYVNTDNLTITVKYNAQTGYKAVLGAGRTDNYYRRRGDGRAERFDRQLCEDRRGGAQRRRGRGRDRRRRSFCASRRVGRSRSDRRPRSVESPGAL